MTQPSGRARFHDGPDSPVESLVGSYPPGGVYRMESDATGTRIYRAEVAPTADQAGPATPASINQAHRRFWQRPSLARR